MAGSIAAITNPISLCAYVVFAVSGGFAALKSNAKSDNPREKRWFYLLSTVSVIALLGGLFLAWEQSPKPAPPPGSSTVIQNSSGDQSPNVNSSGSGAVTVQSGNAPVPPPQKPEEKKK